MSTLSRDSSETLKRHGVQKRTIRKQDRFINVYSNASTLQKAIDTASINLANPEYKTDSITADAFFVTKGVLIRNGISDVAADTMALLLNDVAKASGMSIYELVGGIEENGLLLGLQTHVLMNVFRSPSDRTNILVKGKNSSSYRARDIIA